MTPIHNKRLSYHIRKMSTTASMVKHKLSRNVETEFYYNPRTDYYIRGFHTRVKRFVHSFMSDYYSAYMATFNIRHSRELTGNL